MRTFANSSIVTLGSSFVPHRFQSLKGLSYLVHVDSGENGLAFLYPKARGFSRPNFGRAVPCHLIRAPRRSEQIFYRGFPA